MNLFSRTSMRLLLLLVVLLPGVSLAATLPDFRKIVRDSSPAVVKIIVQSSGAQLHPVCPICPVPDKHRYRCGIDEIDLRIELQSCEQDE